MTDRTKVLTPQRVDAIFQACLFMDGEDSSDNVPAEGIVIRKVGFHPVRIEVYRQEIHDMLAELSDDCKSSGGGGMSFLNMCRDRHGNVWTGEHIVQEQLVLLGIAIGEVEYCLPRDMWTQLPGGVPYVRVNQ